ncbi:TetR/AcrR family transcriptional regulator [Actinoplanes palleronii]|uniref:TetR family transcriptional regulator n=1 Tax=Actinoplanes palleronii TaxID=113570 RepID=A0ABQ4BMG3_9ACTN|nr:TetR/AcrR family transcriptional regulator [Actinoplanes palleronii]GIE71820.1 TetR family transcriptional regulator [Actinoplanes palleronii]
MRSDGVDSRRTDTRERAVGVALSLFAQRGYTATSLREIAEQLGITKAALYFHFRTKEEILTAILRGYLDGINALVVDAARPLTADGQEALLRGFAAHQERWGLDLVMLVRQNYTEIHGLPIGAEIKSAMRSLIEALSPEGAGPEQRLRVRLALSAFQIAAVTASIEDDGDEATLRASAYPIALEILRGGKPA